MANRTNTGFWQISIICDSLNAPLLVTVPENCYTEELFKNLRKHPRAPRIDDFQLYSISGTIRRDLSCNMTERLSDYGITHLSSLAMVARLQGGVWPTLEQVISQSRHLVEGNGITVTTSRNQKPDIVTLEFEGARAVMPCGHAIGPQTLALYCYHELESGKDEIRCPECSFKWKFALIRHAACLSSNEVCEFEARAQRNFLRNHPSETNSCPKCGTFSRPSRENDKRVICSNCTSLTGKTFEFCWSCLHEWKSSDVERCGNSECEDNRSLFEILVQCPLKYIDGIQCPSKRACPKCATIIEHIEKCKHMTCASCKYEFCFICLWRWPCRYHPQFTVCTMAPRQTSDTKFLGAEADIGPPPRPQPFREYRPAPRLEIEQDSRCCLQ